jgi:serine/threonine protein kinase
MNELKNLLICQFKFSGQSAVVRVAVEKSSGRTFAAKLVRRRRKGAGDERREAAVLASLRHPNVVGLHETFQQAQHFVLILELYVLVVSCATPAL